MIKVKGNGLSIGMVSWAMLSGYAHAYDVCGSLQNAYGPFDYWVDKNMLGVVEDHHFTPEVESLVRGKSGYIGGDIDYTLRAFPNHPRALLAMVRLGEKIRSERPGGANYSVRCYLDRAIRFRPNDSMARMIYSFYLVKRKKNAEALEHLEVATQHATESGNLHYNLGLVYIDLGKYDRALQHAQEAYRLGFNLPGLRAKLEKAGKWQDPPAAKTEPDKEQGAESAAGDLPQQ
ncbi:MAG: tetratricopeptide repeat protein [Gammaproteobacteria bacterium]|nr:tetratricopeptide repeat protein [Gammaproteobacteria bacterium]MBU4006167.1 tetratricopeptide repeat protein [Gammaproteobacteria bacterium]MBU4022622.1 tetratricopeptide repeat protein [Gammaproteobacteria bacterium]MBU4097122.1 tetratricopeptide repeat protein [Gammaproteobacteria bacterium]MBU4146914.1 tetratricopeptide repeat protein [Gammaproteobacteria bacterium]